MTPIPQKKNNLKSQHDPYPDPYPPDEVIRYTLEWIIIPDPAQIARAAGVRQSRV